MKRIFAIGFLALFAAMQIFVPYAAAEEKKGKLDSFEEAAQKPADDSGKTSLYQTDTGSTTASLDAKDVATVTIIEILTSFFLTGLMQTGSENLPELYKELKAEWHPALPTVRFEPAYQWAAGNINAIDGKLELGYLIVGVDGEYTRYFDQNSSGSLDVWQSHFLLRTIFTKFFGINLAIGAKGLRGNQSRTDFEIGAPFYVYPSKHFIIDIQPFIATGKRQTIYDIGGGVAYKYKLFGARAGYRALFVGGQRIHGPRIGVFLQY